MIPAPRSQAAPMVWEAFAMRLMRDHAAPETITTYLTAVHDQQTNKIGA